VNSASLELAADPVDEALAAIGAGIVAVVPVAVLGLAVVVLAAALTVVVLTAAVLAAAVAALVGRTAVLPAVTLVGALGAAVRLARRRLPRRVVVGIAGVVGTVVG